MEIELAEELARRIRARCKVEGIKPTTWGQKYFRNRKIVERLENGGSITLDTCLRIQEQLNATPTEPAE